MLLSAHVERFSFSRMRDSFYMLPKTKTNTNYYELPLSPVSEPN